MAQDLDTVVDALKAAGEPTRLRVLALLRHGDLAVGELVDILDQSQPRLSHHLKALTLAGLIERLPEGSWVFYRLASRGWAARLLAAIFAELASEEGVFERDQEALAAVRQARASTAEAYFAEIAEEWDDLRAMHFPNEAIEDVLKDMIGPGPFRRLVDLGTGTGRMLTLFGPLAREAEGLDLSHAMLTVARANLARTNVSHARVRQGDVTAPPFEDASADLVIIHQVLHYIESPADVIEEAWRLLGPDGRLIIVDFAPHDIDFLRQTHGHRRLGIRDDDLRSWAEAAGFEVEPVRRFDPPASLDEGLAVHIWQARRPALEKEAVA